MERIAVPATRRPTLRRPKRLLALRSDARLVEGVRAGDEAAFEVLYERHVAGVLGFCRHMLGSQHEAEDAVQQAFVAAHRDMLRGSREINFKPWLYTIARNRSLSMLRARREQPSELAEISTSGLQEQVAERSDLRELVGDVQRLPADQRAALVLGELGDLSHAEIADVIGVEPMAVKGLVFRARSALIERRDAREADCVEIREELAAATGGGLRRSRLRFHLESCPGCRAYLEDVRRQRKLLGLALPVVPTLALKDSVMAAAGVGSAGAAGGAIASGGVAAGGAAGGGAAAGGSAAVTATTAPILGGTLAKVALVGALATGTAGVATEVVRDRGGGADGSGSNVPAQQQGQGPRGGEAGDGDPTRRSNGMSEGARAGERSRGVRGAERRERGGDRALERSDGRSRGRPGENGKRLGAGSDGPVEPPGKPVAPGRPAEPGPRATRPTPPRRPTSPPSRGAPPDRGAAPDMAPPRPVTPPAPAPKAGREVAPPVPEQAPPSAGGGAPPTSPGNAGSPPGRSR